VLDDLSDPSRSLRGLSKRVERMPVQSAAGDSGHAGSGTSSVSLGAYDASGYGSVAIGDNGEASGDGAVAAGPGASALGLSSTATGDVAQAWGDLGSAYGNQARANAFKATALGANTRALHSRATAVGEGAQTTASNQVMLGTASDDVHLPGTYSTPSARHLKQGIIPAPRIVSIFPELVEYEYIADDFKRRRLGYIADDMIGTDAERFVVLDSSGRPASVAYLDMVVAQTAVMHEELVQEKAENAELRERLGRLEALVDSLINGKG
jgi:hypothetical protein